MRFPAVILAITTTILIGCDVHPKPTSPSETAPRTASVAESATISAEIQACTQGSTIAGVFSPLGIQNKPVTLEPGATFSGVGQNAYISSSVTWIVESRSATLFFPVGDAAGYRPVELTIHQTTGEQTAFLAEVINRPAPDQDQLALPLQRVSDVRYWRIVRCGPGQLKEIAVTLTYGEDDGVMYTPTLRLAHSGGDTWRTVGRHGTGSSTTGGGMISSDWAITNPPEANLFALAGIGDGEAANPLE